MSREIKFRAWEKPKPSYINTESANVGLNGRMFPWEAGIEIYQDGVRILDVEGGVHHLDCELMQFTGLFDKNGKEIYEGDIVNISSFKPSVYQICFDRGAFYIAREDRHEVGDIKYAEDGEVIGNIYEQGELIDKALEVKR